jgi:hypothetical protein
MNRTQATILSLYFLLFGACVFLVIASDSLVGPSVGARLADVSTEGVKLTIAALLGALSTLLGSTR